MHLNLFMGVTCMNIAVSDISFLNIKGPNCSLQIVYTSLGLRLSVISLFEKKEGNLV